MPIQTTDKYERRLNTITNPIQIGSSITSKEHRLDIKNGRLYSDKFTLNVLDLTHINLADDEDKQWELDYWAKLFKATTWEEIKMIAAKNEYFTEASNTFCDLYADENVREQCRDLEDFLYRQKYTQERLAQLEATINRQNSTINQQNSTIIQQKEEIKRLHETLAQLQAEHGM